MTEAIPDDGTHESSAETPDMASRPAPNAATGCSFDDDFERVVFHYRSDATGTCYSFRLVNLKQDALESIGISLPWGWRVEDARAYACTIDRTPVADSPAVSSGPLSGSLRITGRTGGAPLVVDADISLALYTATDAGDPDTLAGAQEYESEHIQVSQLDVSSACP